MLAGKSIESDGAESLPVNRGGTNRSLSGKKSDIRFDVGTDRRVLARVFSRPEPEKWAADELMTLAEAAALFWPDGPVTVPTLRTLVRKGQLRIAIVGRRHMTSRRAVEEMQVAEVRRHPAADRIPAATPES
jgi:hypothetical protein